MVATIMEWFSSMDTMNQIYWSCAIISSLIFVVQFVLTLIGMDTDLDMDVDFDGDTMDFGGLSLFSIRSLTNFFVGFGWAGISLSGMIENKAALIIISMIIGVLFGMMFFFIKKQTKKLEQNGAVQITDSVGKMCDVYLRIPNNRNGKGKVQISLNGSIHEFDAVTNKNDTISSGSKVTVMAVEGDILVVE